MKSKASIKGHPIHPMLVSFPIAFFTGTFICSIVFYSFTVPFFGRMAILLEIAGIVSALLAAVPGIIDYYATIPPESSAKKRGTKHGLLNITMVLLFTMALLVRRNEDVNFLTVLLLEGAGMALLTAAGWMGGTLVVRNQVGIDHRYAGAGKWSEETIEPSSTGAVRLHNLDKLNLNQMKLIHVNGKRIVIGRTESGFVAFDDRCTHRGGSLADGAMICETVQCPWHGSQFNVNSGVVNAGPAKEKIKTYLLTEENGSYFLQL